MNVLYIYFPDLNAGLINLHIYPSLSPLGEPLLYRDERISPLGEPLLYRDERILHMMCYPMKQWAISKGVIGCRWRGGAAAVLGVFTHLHAHGQSTVRSGTLQRIHFLNSAWWEFIRHRCPDFLTRQWLQGSNGSCQWRVFLQLYGMISISCLSSDGNHDDEGKNTPQLTICY
jgi:hypothetical protein